MDAAPRTDSVARRGPRRRIGTVSTERSTNAAATDWQIVLQLKELFAQDPRLIRVLLDGLPSHSRDCLVTVFSAAREAAADQPDRPELQRLAGEAAVRAGEHKAARPFLQRAIEKNPGAFQAISLLTRWVTAARSIGRRTPPPTPPDDANTPFVKPHGREDD